MRNTTLCYLERDGRYLMLHRTVKENDLNKDKWIGIGGKFEEGESPEDCLRREVFEETGLTLDSWRYCGIVTFVSDGWGTEYMHLFHTGAFHGTLRQKGPAEYAGPLGGRPHLPPPHGRPRTLLFPEAPL